MGRIVRWGLFTHPLVLPAAVVWCTVAVLAWWFAGVLRSRAGRPPPTVWPLLFACALGVLVAVTLTPSRIGLGLEFDNRQLVWCRPQWPRTGFGLTAPSGERRWNVLIAVPLGLSAAGWFRSGLRRGRAVAALAPVAALALPGLVELVQASVPDLGRVCAVVDAVDNVSGVLLGFALVGIGAALAAVHGVVRSRPRRA